MKKGKKMTIYKVHVKDAQGIVVADFGYYEDYDDANTRKIYLMSKVSQYPGTFEVKRIEVIETEEIAKPINRDYYQLK